MEALKWCIVIYHLQLIGDFFFAFEADWTWFGRTNASISSSLLSVSPTITWNITNLKKCVRLHIYSLSNLEEVCRHRHVWLANHLDKKITQESMIKDQEYNLIKLDSGKICYDKSINVWPTWYFTYIFPSSSMCGKYRGPVHTYTFLIKWTYLVSMKQK